jgi:hypothetical protein
MAKLKKELRSISNEMMDTFLAGCRDYPKSHSDLYGGIYASLKMFDVKRLPLQREIYVTSEEFDAEEIAESIASGVKRIESPCYVVTVEKK